MFGKSTKSILVALALVSGAFIAAPASAGPSNSFGVYIGGGHGGVYIGNVHHRGYGRRAIAPRRGFCGPRKAVNKAWHMGINRPHVSRVTNRRIAVTGFNRGHRAKVVFKRDSRRCRIIATRGL
ncbi:MAG: hypothetical protein AAF412_03915 [Pseudomonadota bacterium]